MISPMGCPPLASPPQVVPGDLATLKEEILEGFRLMLAELVGGAVGSDPSRATPRGSSTLASPSPYSGALQPP